MVTNGSTITTTDYANGFVYTNNALTFINQPEGYVEPDGTSFRYVYQYKDHLGNIRLSYSDYDGSGTITSSTEVVEENNYYPFGLKHYGYNDAHNGSEHKFKYNGKELQDDAVGTNALNMYDYGARFYDPAVGRWFVPDPLAEKYMPVSPYTYAINNPIRLIDIDGLAPGDPPGPGYYSASINSRYIGFGLRHPVASIRIGFGVTRGATNISTNATRGEVLYGSKRSQEDKGSENGAFRHGLWQATITSEFGRSVAAQAGNAHEENAFADLSNRSFTNLDEADQTVDLLNNVIGRSIGEANEGASMNELANLVLDEFKENGLYTASKDKEGNWVVSKTKLSSEKYNQLKDIFKGLNENGRTAAEQKQVDAKAKKHLEELQQIWGTTK
ncbi:MAG: RHS repeat-associated core domain-containing protein [Bacteroidales bacterium]|nr:RHS repeat-associated core domain-containing protein [Bacteroidales bacterium]